MTQETLLQTIIQTMKGGVVACDAKQHITLFNRAAQNLLNQNKSLKPGAPLYSFFPAGPIKHALALLGYRQAANDHAEPAQQFIQFMNSTCDQSRFYQCRLCLMPTAAQTDHSFVIIFEDAGSWYAPGNLVYLQTEELRGPIANLRAAVENITEHPDMPPVMRSAFENVLVQESLNLSNSFDSFADTCHGLIQAQSHLVAMQASFLFGYLQDYLNIQGISVNMGEDCSHMIKVDSHGLLLVIEFMVKKLNKDDRATSLACEIHCGKQFAYVDLLWSGEPLGSVDIENWMDEVLQESVGRATLSLVLQGQGADIWSQAHSKPGFSMVRLAIPAQT